MLKIFLNGSKKQTGWNDVLSDADRGESACLDVIWGGKRFQSCRRLQDQTSVFFFFLTSTNRTCWFYENGLIYIP